MLSRNPGLSLIVIFFDRLHSSGNFPISFVYGEIGSLPGDSTRDENQPSGST